MLLVIETDLGIKDVVVFSAIIVPLPRLGTRFNFSL